MCFTDLGLTRSGMLSEVVKAGYLRRLAPLQREFFLSKHNYHLILPAELVSDLEKQ